MTAPQPADDATGSPSVADQLEDCARVMARLANQARLADLDNAVLRVRLWRLIHSITLINLRLNRDRP